MKKLIAAFAAAPLLALSLGFGAAQAQVGDDLPRAKTDVWTAEKYRNGAVAQVNADGDGRFAVVCTQQDFRGRIIYLPPAGDRKEIRNSGNEIKVIFNFDKGRNKITRDLTWEPDGNYWTGPFGPNSPLADWMKRAYNVRINVLQHEGVFSNFSLKDSFKSVTRMFDICN